MGTVAPAAPATTQAQLDDSTLGGADLTLITPGTLTVCTDIPYKPMEFEDNGVYTGFDVDLMQAIADELGLEFNVVATGFDSMTSGTAMAGNQCDIAASAITITEEREQNIDFSDPYYNAAQSLLVKKDSGIKTLEEFAGKRLGVQSGTTGEAYAQENAPATAEIVSFETGGDLFLALEAHNIVGILQKLEMNGARLTEDSTLSIVETYPTGEFYGFAAKRTGDEVLLTAVNEALAAVKRTGTYDQIWNKWFGTR